MCEDNAQEMSDVSHVEGAKTPGGISVIDSESSSVTLCPTDSGATTTTTTTTMYPTNRIYSFSFRCAWRARARLRLVSTCNHIHTHTQSDIACCCSFTQCVCGYVIMWCVHQRFTFSG